MPRTPDPTARERILRAAGELFYDRGVQAVSMAQIVEAAGCGKQVLYRHFPSKSDLVAAYLAAFGRDRDRDTEEALAGLDDDPAAGLLSLTRLIATRAEDARFRGCAVRDYVREFRRYDDPPGQVAIALMTAWRARVDALVARLDVADPPVLADRIWLVQEGLYAAGARHDEAARSGVALDLVRALLDAATRERAGGGGAGAAGVAAVGPAIRRE